MENSSRGSLGAAGPTSSFASGASRFELTKGQTFVEFAMVATLFLLVLFAVMDYGWLMFAQMNVQQAVQDGGRYASTGNHVTDSKGNTLSRIDSIIQVIQNEVSVPGVNPQNVQFSSVSSTTGAVTTGSAGGPGDTVTVTLVTTLPLLTPLVGQFFPSGGYTFTSSATFKNEPFDPNNAQ